MKDEYIIVNNEIIDTICQYDYEINAFVWLDKNSNQIYYEKDFCESYYNLDDFRTDFLSIEALLTIEEVI